MIGVGIITCDRVDFFNQCLESINLDEVDHVVIVNDGYKNVTFKSHSKIEYHIIGPRSGVGNAKSTALKHLLEMGCIDLFLIEDDIVVKQPGVFKRYAEASKLTGIQHFMFGYHGPANKGGISGGAPIAKYKYEMGTYSNGDPLVVAINQHCVGAFCYYTRKALEVCGNFDLEFNNAFEHIEHSLRIAQAGLSTGYWNWADIADSCDWLQELACSEVSSSIRGEASWQQNINNGIELFIKKHNQHPFRYQDVEEAEIKQTLKKLYNDRYSNRN